jgi:hypothetical protein
MSEEQERQQQEGVDFKSENFQIVKLCLMRLHDPTIREGSGRVTKRSPGPGPSLTVGLMHGSINKP